MIPVLRRHSQKHKFKASLVFLFCSMPAYRDGSYIRPYLKDIHPSTHKKTVQYSSPVRNMAGMFIGTAEVCPERDSSH